MDFHHFLGIQEVVMRIEWRTSYGWLAIGALVMAVLIPTETRAANENICYLQAYPVTKVRCQGDWKYIGPINWGRYGGYCVLPQQKCIKSITVVTSKNCGDGKYVGATHPSRFGGNCIYPETGWEVVVQPVASRTARCRPPTVYLGPHSKSRGGHCVTIKKK